MVAGATLTAADEHAVDPGRRGPERSERRWPVVVAVLLAALPIAVSTVRAIDRGWLPVGDNALFQIRARDVLTDHHPLLGTWTSASVSIGESVNNPGPLFFDLLALPAKIDGDAGLAAGVALLNIASIVVIAAVATRRAGTVAGVASVAAAAALGWTMGSELLFDPWQPHALLLPFLAFLVLTWALACGEEAMLVWVAALGSLIVQTHLSYAVVVPALALLASASLARSLAHARRDVPSAWPARRRRVARVAIVTVAVVAVAWAQPLVEQVTADGKGNLEALATNTPTAGETVGLALSIRLVAEVVSWPPSFLRPSFERGFLNGDGVPPLAGDTPNLEGLPGTGAAAASLAAVVAALLALGFAARRRSRYAAVATGIAVAGIALALATTASLPVGPFGVAQHQLRLLWPLALFAAFAALLCLHALAGEPPPRVLAAAAVAVVAVLAVATIPSYNPGVGPSADAEAIPVVRQLNRQLDGLEDGGPVLVQLAGLRFAEPYSTPLLAELQRRGVEFFVDDEGWADQLGPARRYHPGDADRRLVIREGDDALTGPPGARRIALSRSLDGDERAELLSLREVAVEVIARDGVELTPAGERAVRRGQIVDVPRRPDARALVDTGFAADLIDRGFVRVAAAERATLTRYAELEQRWRLHTVGVYVVPIEAGG